MSGNHRIKIRGPQAAYHVVTRANHREYRLNDHMKRFFVSTLSYLAKTYFCRVHAYTVLDSHYHVLVSFDHPKHVDPDQAIYRWNRYHGGRYHKNRSVQEHRAYVVDCLTDISHFMKKLNTLLTREYNRRNGHVGTLWERRFRSSIVERGRALLMTAAYIELNSFRASMVAKPEDYKYSSLYELKRHNRSHILHTQALAGTIGLQGYENIEQRKRKFTGKTKAEYKRYIKELYKEYVKYIYRRGTQAPKRKLIRGRADSIKISDRMQEVLEEKVGGSGPDTGGGLQKGTGLCRRIWTFTRGKFIGSRGFAKAFYSEHVDPGYVDKSRSNRHKSKWMHGMAGGVWGVFNGSRKNREEQKQRHENGTANQNKTEQRKISDKKDKKQRGNQPP